jgi:tRNA G46 methylase TrmB
MARATSSLEVQHAQQYLQGVKRQGGQDCTAYFPVEHQPLYAELGFGGPPFVGSYALGY